MVIRIVCLMLVGRIFIQCAKAGEDPPIDFQVEEGSGEWSGSGRIDEVLEVNDEAIEYILQTHNDARQKVFPPASSLSVIEWDEDLANQAEVQASTCNTTTVIPAELFYTILLSLTETTVLEFQRTRIDETVETFDYENRECSAPCSTIYFAAISEEIKKVGCAFSTCDIFTSDDGSTSENSFILTCVYPVTVDVRDEEGDIIPPYEAGYPCSNCGAGYPVCDAYYSLCPTQIPTRLELIQQPGPEGNPAGEPFAVQPELVLYDENDEPYKGLANPSCYWYVGVFFSHSSNTYANILGNIEVPVVNGTAVFEGIGISEYGEYELQFFVSLPDLYDISEFRVHTDTILIGLPPETDGQCIIQEGDSEFERSYEWGAECSNVCIADCDGHHEECVDLDQCGPHAECNGSECVCDEIHDFEFDIFEEANLAIILNPVVNCLPDCIEIRLDKCGMNALGYTLSNTFILGNNGGPVEIDYTYDIDNQLWPFIESCAYNDCRGTVTADENGIVYSMKVRGNFGDCNGEIHSNATHITYTHMIRGYGGWSNSIISRMRPIVIEYSCSYGRRILTTSSTHVTAFTQTISLSLAAESDFNVNMDIMTDSTYEQAYTSTPTIMVPDDIYIEIFLSDVDTDGLTLFADRCYATPSDNPFDATYEDLILDGCPVDGLEVTVAQNGEDEFVLFSFESFVMVGQGDSIYIHCDVNVCLSDDLAPCTTSCVSRKRRSASESSDYASAKVSLGPITVQNNARKKRSTSSRSRLYSSSFSHKYSTMELANPPFARTTGVGSYAVSFV